MNASRFRALRVPAVPLLFAGVTVFPAIAAAQQPYHNVINQKFRAVANGPQSGIIVDVKDPKDAEGVRRAVQTSVRATLRVHASLLEREISELRRRHLLKNNNQQFPLVELVRLRQNGRLVTASPNRGRTRGAPGSNKLNINIVTQGANAFDTSSKIYNSLRTFVPLLNTQLTNILGAPFSNYTVNIRSLDPDDPKLNVSVRGAIIEVDTTNSLINIDFPSFSSDQDTLLGLAQTLAQAFYAPHNFGFDVYGQGIARAAAVIAVQNIIASGSLGSGFDPVDSVPGFYYTPFYDLLNQPALGNNSFFPPTPSKQSVAGLAGMLIPRLQMASTAWTKCYIEDNNFFVNFNNAYYDQVNADGNVASNSSQLQNIAASVLLNVEGLPFNTWYQQQYIFDTSVTSGPKLFAYSQPTFPDSQGDAGASILLVYYNTDKSGDEKPLSGVSNPVYFDYTYSNRLVLSNGNAQEPINSGLGSASPFFTGIGDPTTGDDKQRIAIDFPVSSSQANAAQPGGNEYVRVYFPANEESIKGVPTDFSGVLIGAKTGFFTVSFNGGNGSLKGGASSQGTPVTAGINGFGFGAFNGLDATGGIVPTGFHKATIQFQPLSGAVITFQRNVFTRKDNANTPTIPGVSPVFVLNTGLNQAGSPNLKHTFNPGPQMVALPIQPFQPYSSNLPQLFSLAPGTPDANRQLIAQYRQDADTSVGKYVRYPSLPLYQPGLSFWTNFAGNINNLDMSAAGLPTDNQDLVSVPLQFGWNMAGNPYSTDLTISDVTSTPGIQVQYQNGDALTLQEAINTGLIAAGVFGYNSVSGVGSYQDITQTTVTGLPQNVLQAWHGYWIRVLVTEGVTLSYINPTPPPTNGRGTRTGKANVRSLRRTRASGKVNEETGSWRLPLLVRDSAGNASSALLGQAAKGSDSFVPALDAASPPPFTRNASLSVRFMHPDWDTGKASSNTGEFLSDIRRTGARTMWNVSVNTPQAEQPYVITWNNAAKLPRGMRLTLIDVDNGTRRLMNSATSYTFTPARGASVRHFQVQAEPRSAGRLLISNFHVDTPRSRGTASAAIISYEVSGAGETSVSILSGGRQIRRLTSGRATTTGVNQVIWDLKDDQGRAMATGTYLIQIDARTPEGETTRAVLPHPVTR